MTKLFVSNLPRKMDEMELAQLFAPCGDIDLLTILRDKFNGKSKCAAFVHMKTEKGAKDAMASLDGLMMGDRKLEVRYAGEKPAPKPAAFKNKRPWVK